MRAIKRHIGRTIAVAAEAGDYEGKLVDAGADRVELRDVRVRVRDATVALTGVVIIPVGQIIHVQVSDA